MSDYTELELRIGYFFKNKKLLAEALTHPSFTKGVVDAEPNYQRLEFLGDSVLGLLIAEALFHAFPNAREGELARYKSTLVKGSYIAVIAQQIELHSFVRVGKNESDIAANQSTLEDSLEALMGAVFVDGGLDLARKVMQSLYGELIDRVAKLEPEENPKGALQEKLFTLTNKEPLIHYMLKDSWGPDHSKHFIIDLFIDGKLIASGEGSSKKRAEEEAAKSALLSLEQKNK